MKLALGAIVKNEESDITEWLAFHLLTEFDCAVVYDNGSTDETKKRLRALQRDFDIRIKDWPHAGAQIAAYNDIIENFGREFEWFSFLDSDEFLVSRGGAGDIRRRLDKLTNADALAINWLCFGSSGFADTRSRMVTPTFFRRSLDQHVTNRHVKSIVRSSEVAKAINPHYFEMKRENSYVSVNNRAMRWSKPGKTTSPVGTDEVRINHYYTRSKAHYDAKIARGRGAATGFRPYEFDVYDRNEVVDLLIHQVYNNVVLALTPLTGKELIWEGLGQETK